MSVQISDWRAVQHGRLTLFAPKDWTDRSQIALVAPEHVPPSAPMSVKTAPPAHRNLAVTLEPTDEPTAQAFVDRMIREHLEGAERLSTGPMVLAGHEGVCVELRVKGARMVRQLIAAALVAPGVALVAAASADEGSFERYRKELLLCLTSILFR